MVMRGVMVTPVRALLGVLVAGRVLPGCAIVPDACPTTFDEARSAEFDAGVDDPFIATGTVVRFVASPDPNSRGYDVNIARHDGPVFVPGVAFVRLAEPMAGIQDGEAVLVIGDRVGGTAVVLSARCPVLQRIDDAGQPGCG